MTVQILFAVLEPDDIAPLFQRWWRNSLVLIRIAQSWNSIDLVLRAVIIVCYHHAVVHIVDVRVRPTRALVQDMISIRPPCGDYPA